MSRSGPVTTDTSTIALGLAQIRVGNSATNIASISPVLVAGDSIGALNSSKYTGNVDFWKLESGFPLLEDMTVPIRETAMLECEFKEISIVNLALARGIDPEAAVLASLSGGTVNSAGTGTTDSTKEISVDQLGGVVTETILIVFTSAIAGDAYGSVSGDLGAFAAIDAAFEPQNGGQDSFSIPADFFTGTWAADDTYTFSTVAAAAAGSGAFDDNHTGAIALGQMSAPAYVRMEAVYTFPTGDHHMYIIFPRANVVSSVELDLQAEDAAAVPITFESKRSDSEVDGGNAVWNASTLGRILFD